MKVDCLPFHFSPTHFQLSQKGYYIGVGDIHILTYFLWEGWICTVWINNVGASSLLSFVFDVIALDNVLFFNQKYLYFSYFSMKTYVVGTLYSLEAQGSS